ncbi:MAG TPA: nucleotidyltransferase domain-containing protein [Candidatus Nanoarchaeia archaeon]|nr:nucleotidyltransferase domain-containing protein [Candidatus Nanoarchaeia archaeon]
MILKYLRSPDVRKVFGKSELKIIEKQLWGIRLTQSEKNRLSRDIRKKLDVIAKLSECRDEFHLRKGQELKKLMSDVQNEILNDKLRNRICEIWLFGSTITDTRTVRSDVDIAVVFDTINLKEATAFRIRISSNFQQSVDIQVFNVLPEKIKNSIKKSHRVLWTTE